jgi:hypothetical protein
MAYGGGHVADDSPAYVNKHKVRDTISRQQKVEHPFGMGWEGDYQIVWLCSMIYSFLGVLHELNVRERSLAKEDCYIHTAMRKNGFRLVGTMHPYIMMFIHKILSFNIDYTFSHVNGDMDEWEVAGFLDRFKHRKVPQYLVQTLLLCLEINLFLKVRQLSSSRLIQLYELQEASPTLACTIHHVSNS